MFGVVWKSYLYMHCGAGSVKVNYYRTVYEKTMRLGKTK